MGRFGGYELIEEIARGGMGVVYKARQLSLNRIVAVKTILGGQMAGAQVARRFKGEAFAAAVLKHPNIVAVHEVGVQDGCHFFSMDYVEGQDLARMVGHRPLAVEVAVRYLERIAAAVQYAHDQGILHRDLKPSNVLVEAATDEPRVTDFGLARRLDEESSLTLSGQVLGSPHFMPPEQAAGGKGGVSRTSDVFGLGAILYFLLTARAPFQGGSVEAVIHQALQADPIAPRTLNPAVPRDLETICLKCLEKDPAKRYPTARALAEDLARFKAEEPIAARRAGQVERVWRWCRRKPALASACGAMALLVLVLAVGGPAAAWRIEQGRQHAETERRRAEAKVEEARLNQYSADMLLAQQALEKNHLGLAAQLLHKHLPPRAAAANMAASALTSASDPRGWEWRYLAGQVRGQQRRVMPIGTHVRQIAYTPDGRTVIVGVKFPWRVEAWDVETGQPRAVWSSNDAGTFDFVVHPDGHEMVVCASRRVHFLHPETLQPSGAPYTTTNDVPSAVYSADGLSLFLIENGNSGAWLVGLDAVQRRVLTRHPVEPSWDLALAPDGATIALATMSREVHVHDVRSGVQRQRMLVSPEPVPDGYLAGNLRFSPDGRWLAAAMWDRWVQVWDTQRWQTAARIRSGNALCMDVLFSEDSSTLYVAHGDQAVEVVDTATWQSRGPLRGHQQEVWTLALAPDGRTLATGSKDKTVRLWNRHAMPGPERVLLPEDTWYAVLSGDGQAALALQSSNRFSIWETRTLSRIGEGILPTDKFMHDMRPSLTKVVLSSNRRWLGIGTWDGAALVWDWAKREVLWESDRERGWVAGVGFSEDDMLFLAGTYDDEAGSGSVRMWESRSGRLIKKVAVSKPVSHMSSSPANAELGLTAFPEEWTALFAPDTGTAVRRSVAAGHRGCRTAFSPDGRWLASAGLDATVQLWEVPSGRPGWSLTGQLNAFQCVSWTPDGRRLAAGGADGSVLVWDPATGQQVSRLEVPPLPGGQMLPRYGIHDIRFLGDGDTLVGVNTSQLWLWRALPVADLPAAAVPNYP